MGDPAATGALHEEGKGARLRTLSHRCILAGLPDRSNPHAFWNWLILRMRTSAWRRKRRQHVRHLFASAGWVILAQELACFVAASMMITKGENYSCGLLRDEPRSGLVLDAAYGCVHGPCHGACRPWIHPPPRHHVVFTRFTSATGRALVVDPFAYTTMPAGLITYMCGVVLTAWYSDLAFFRVCKMGAPAWPS